MFSGISSQTIAVAPDPIALSINWCPSTAVPFTATKRKSCCMFLESESKPEISLFVFPDICLTGIACINDSNFIIVSVFLSDTILMST